MKCSYVADSCASEPNKQDGDALRTGKPITTKCLQNLKTFALRSPGSRPALVMHAWCTTWYLPVEPYEIKHYWSTSAVRVCVYSNLPWGTVENASLGWSALGLSVFIIIWSCDRRDWKLRFVDVHEFRCVTKDKYLFVRKMPKVGVKREKWFT